ncbi:hypothetical protein AQUCO_02700430v1 [Aquilegia coerulea]|uniref:Uncharacterized protein n=1 Tax=Aquilegia coerulea TaxID=218851 RepID=A0A2G5D7Q9_AQUCA|nr:hypothetical protein AQUCO_02700430v1 [Aquilegia coerulea]
MTLGVVCGLQRAFAITRKTYGVKFISDYDFTYGLLQLDSNYFCCVSGHYCNSKLDCLELVPFTDYSLEPIARPVMSTQ